MITVRRIRLRAAPGLLASLIVASSLVAPNPRAAVQAVSIGVRSVRYTSASYGYSVQIPPGWLRVPHVHWTPQGPPADLTLMPPDHQAALGVIVAPTGPTRYSATELQSVALRLIAQESPVPSVGPLEGYARITQEVIQTRVVHQITYQTVTTDLDYGGHMVCRAQMSVAVTQQHQRLYVLVAVVYEAIFGLPPAGGEPAATPTPGFGLAPGARPNAVAPAGASHGVLAPAGRRVQERSGAAPVPLPTDHERGNRCRTHDDVGLVFLDKNCAAPRYIAALQQAVASMRIGVQAADPRPAPTVGADGFATYTNSAQGVTVRYPAQWTPVAVPGALGAVQAPDQTALVLLLVQPTQGAPSAADLQAIADQQIGQVGTVVLPPTHKTITMNGVPAVIALASGVGITTGSMVGGAQVSVLVTAYHHRLYLTRAATLLVHSGILDTIAVHYPYFSPFTALARRAVFDFEPSTGALFTHSFDLGLAVDTALSMSVDPRVPDPTASGGTHG